MVFAEQRSSITQFELGEMFSAGPDDTRDYLQAANWFHRAAKQGNPEAQYKLGVFYARGLGVKLDYIRAYAWLKVAAAQGSSKALRYLKKIASRLPGNRQQDAQALSQKYYQRYVINRTGC